MAELAIIVPVPGALPERKTGIYGACHPRQ